MLNMLELISAREFNQLVKSLGGISAKLAISLNPKPNTVHISRSYSRIRNYLKFIEVHNLNSMVRDET